MRKAANRMNFDFNKAEDEYIDGDEVVGLGTIGKEGSGRLKLVASQQKVRGRGPMDVTGDVTGGTGERAHTAVCVRARDAKSG